MGATFTVSLLISGISADEPIQTETAKRQSSSFNERSFIENGWSPIVLPRLDNLNVLIVDDDADALDLLTTILTR
jgi:hypothetical protein